MKVKTILLVEDNPDDAKLTMLALEESGIASEVVAAWDGVDALDYLFGTGNYAGRDTRQMPAVILLDLKIPRIDGLAVLKRIRSDERTALLPVVILTTSMEDSDRQASYRLGANSYIRKSVDFNLFVEVVKQLSQYWLMLNEGP